MFQWVQSAGILDWCDIRVVSEVLDIVGHDFSCLSSAILNRIISRRNYKIRDNIFGTVVGEVEAYLGSFYVPSVSVNAFTVSIHSYHIWFKSSDRISIT